ncbi:MAG: hypothetical protein FWE07_09195 [Turicibacter sp.]|nr:hypothetical protein [Turicibacter sp.]
MKILILIFIAFFLIFGVPLGVSLFYTGGLRMISGDIRSATALLQYYASIFGTSIVAIGLYLTYRSRREEARIQRNDYIFNSIMKLFSKIKINLISETYIENITIWRDNPTEIYRFIEDIDSVIDINLSFSMKENEKIMPEFPFIKAFADLYRNTLLIVYLTCSQRNSLMRKMLDLELESKRKIDDLLRKEQESCDAALSEELDFNELKNLLIKTEKEVEKLSEEIKKLDDSIFSQMEELSKIYKKDYSKVKEQINKLKEKLMA